MTKSLYHDDSYLTEFDSRIVSICNGGKEVVLAETTFYPEGGGQPCDTGTLEINDKTYNVISVRSVGETVYHCVDEILPSDLPETTVVHGRVDESRRQYHRRHHTALHLLNAAVLKFFNAKVTGGQVGTPYEHSRHDFELDNGLSSEERTALESWVNQVIKENHPVITRIFTEAESKQIPHFCRTVNVHFPKTKEGGIRGVEIPGIDIQACGGTHVRNTGEIGTFKILKIDNKGRNLRRIKITLD